MPFFFAPVIALSLLLSACGGDWPSFSASDTSETPQLSSSEQQSRVLQSRQLVSRSQNTAEAILGSVDFKGVEELLPLAKGVMIFPNLVKAGFIVGGEGGVGTVLVRRDDGSWSYPAFYNMVGGSVGLQVGVESSEVLFLVMTQAGINALINNQFKLGADVSMALGPIGAGLGAGKSSADFATDIYVYSKASGLYGGGALKGAIITARPDLNQAFYGSPASSDQILSSPHYVHSDAEGLRAALSGYSSQQPHNASPITPVEQF